MNRYRIINWTEYNRALIQRGDLNLWLSQEVISRWEFPPHLGRNGRPYEYSDDAILCMLAIRQVYQLPLRALQGFVESLFKRLGVELPVPSYSTICRRAKVLSTRLRKLSQRRPTDIVLDSSGLKIYGEGEWKVRQHGTSKRRTWRKLHIALDPVSQEILVSELTSANESDSMVGSRLLKKLPKTVNKILGDGAYDGMPFRKSAIDLGIRPIVPPRRGACFSKDKTPEAQSRDEAIAIIKGLGGNDLARKAWKVLSGYHIRSLVETAFSRLKTIFGSRLRSRLMETQTTETHVRCMILNTLTKLGMPIGYWKDAA